MSDRPGREFRLERTITIGLIITLALETAGAMVWVGAAEARLSELERATESRWEVSERLARLEGETAMMREQLGRIEEAIAREN